MEQYADVTIGNKDYHLEVAASPEKQRLGLSGRINLPADEGMLFQFNDCGLRRFHTVGMNFPIDILWLDDNGILVGLYEYAPPMPQDTNVDNAPKFFSPVHFPVKYVIELIGGEARRNEVQIGDEILHFQNTGTVFVIQKSVDDLYEWLEKQQPPGPPPRPGLQWKPQTHRWIRPRGGPRSIDVVEHYEQLQKDLEPLVEKWEQEKKKKEKGGFDVRMKAIMELFGNDRLPRVVGKHEIDKMIQQGGKEVMRGTSKSAVKNFVQGEYFPYPGRISSGVYASFLSEDIKHREATIEHLKGYARETGAYEGPSKKISDPVLMRMVLPKQSKWVAIADLHQMRLKDWDALKTQDVEQMPDWIRDIGMYAIAKGYDAIGSDPNDFVIILNRHALTIQDESIGVPLKETQDLMKWLEKQQQGETGLGIAPKETFAPPHILETDRQRRRKNLEKQMGGGQETGIGVVAPMVESPGAWGKKKKKKAQVEKVPNNPGYTTYSAEKMEKQNDLVEWLEKQPGPPPRPGLKWKPSTHRWIRPQISQEKPTIDSDNVTGILASHPDPKVRDMLKRASEISFQYVKSRDLNEANADIEAFFEDNDIPELERMEAFDIIDQWIEQQAASDPVSLRSALGYLLGQYDREKEEKFFVQRSKDEFQEDFETFMQRGIDNAHALIPFILKSQWFLKNRYKGENVPNIYRGVVGDLAKKIYENKAKDRKVKIPNDGISSFSSSLKIARHFAFAQHGMVMSSKYGAIIKKKNIPINSIWFAFEALQARYPEKEILVDSRKVLTFESNEMENVKDPKTGNVIQKQEAGGFGGGAGTVATSGDAGFFTPTYGRHEKKKKKVQELKEWVNKQQQPGPPPRPGLQWKPQTRRWIRPKESVKSLIEEMQNQVWSVLQQAEKDGYDVLSEDHSVQDIAEGLQNYESNLESVDISVLEDHVASWREQQSDNREVQTYEDSETSYFSPAPNRREKGVKYPTMQWDGPDAGSYALEENTSKFLSTKGDVDVFEKDFGFDPKHVQNALKQIFGLSGAIGREIFGIIDAKGKVAMVPVEYLSPKSGLHRIQIDDNKIPSTAVIAWHTHPTGTAGHSKSDLQAFKNFQKKHNMLGSAVIGGRGGGGKGVKTEILFGKNSKVIVEEEHSNDAIQKMRGWIAKQQQPGPPPRPGLQWKPQTRRWIRPAEETHPSQSQNGELKDLIVGDAEAKRVLDTLSVHGEPYIVGGGVRDALLGIPNKDVDIEVHGISIDDLAEIVVRDFGGKKDQVGKKFGVFKVEDFDISLPRTETKTGTKHTDFEVVADPTLPLEEAAKRRDLTINALMYDYKNDEVLDFFGGLNDIENKVIKHVAEETFVEDPLRVYRAAQFAARFGFTIDPSTQELAKSMDLSDLPKERVFGEFAKLLLKSPEPSVGLQALDDMGVLDRYYPEIAVLKDTPQRDEHHAEGNVFNHTKMAIDKAAEIIQRYDDPKDKIIIMLATLCHDFGKATTTKEGEKGTIAHHGHEDAGVEPALQFLSKITAEQDIVKIIPPLIQQHLVPPQYHRDEKIKNSAFRRLINKHGLKFLDLLSAVSEADVGGRFIRKPDGSVERPEGGENEWFRAKIKDIASTMGTTQEGKIIPLISGNDLKELGFTEGPKLGAVLRDIKTQQEEGTLTSAEEALAYVHDVYKSDTSALKNWIQKQQPPGPPPRPGLQWKPQTRRWIRPVEETQPSQSQSGEKVTPRGKEWWQRTGGTEKPQTTIPLTPIESFDSPLSAIYPNITPEQAKETSDLTEALAENAGKSVGEFVEGTYGQRTPETIREWQNTNLDSQFDLLLNKFGNTAWGKAAKKAANLRSALTDLAEGKELTEDRSKELDEMLKDQSSLREAMEKKGWEGLWEHVGTNKWVGIPSKPSFAIASSPINCLPSEECAIFCYAFNGRGAMPNALFSAEVIDILAHQDPERAAEKLVAQYKTTAGYKNGNALRFFDRGEGSEAWLKVIKKTNELGVRAHVFSKRPEFLQQISPDNVRLLSIDPSNSDLARDNDLPVAFIFTGSGPSVVKKTKAAIPEAERKATLKKNIALAEELASRIQVVLPVQGADAASAEDIKELESQDFFKENSLAGNMCPIDRGKREVSYHFNRDPKPVYFHTRPGVTRSRHLASAQANSINKKGWYQQGTGAKSVYYGVTDDGKATSEKPEEGFKGNLNLDDSDSIESKQSWTCGNCDNKGGMGCYKGQATANSPLAVQKAVDSSASPLMSVSNRDLTAYLLMIGDRRAVDRAFSRKPTVTQMIKELGFVYRRSMTPEQNEQVKKDSGVKDDVWTSDNELQMAKLLYKGFKSSSGKEDWRTPFKGWLLASYDAVAERIEVKPKLKAFIEAAKNDSIKKSDDLRLVDLIRGYDPQTLLNDLLVKQGVVKQQAPGPPPRPGLQWKPQTSRWIRPVHSTGEDQKTKFAQEYFGEESHPQKLAALFSKLTAEESMDFLDNFDDLDYLNRNQKMFGLKTLALIGSSYEIKAKAWDMFQEKGYQQRDPIEKISIVLAQSNNLQHVKTAIGKLWQGAASDSVLGDLINNAARQEFGLEGEFRGYSSNSLQDEQINPVIKQALRDMYRETQEFYKGQDTISLMRGVRGDWQGTNQIESWTTSEKIAKKFAGKKGRILNREIPISEIVFSYQTHPKILSRMKREEEFVVRKENIGQNDQIFAVLSVQENDREQQSSPSQRPSLQKFKDWVIEEKKSQMLLSVQDVQRMTKDWRVADTDFSKLSKAVITTPMTDEGKFDAESVPNGATVWITVTDPQSPLHGRPIMITRRPDGLFAITGGAGQDEETEARRHMVLTGSPKRTKRDKELEDEIEEAKAYNEPLISARRELETESRKEIKEAADTMMQALGLQDPNKKELLSRRDEIQNHIESVLGEENKDQSKRVTDAIMRNAVKAERSIKDRVQRERQRAVFQLGKRLQRLREEDVASAIQEEMPQMYGTVDAVLPDIENLADMTPQEQEHEIVRHFDQQTEDFFDEDRIEQTSGEDTPSLTLGETVQEPLNLKSREDLEQAVSAVQDYWGKRSKAEQLKSELKRIPLAKATPSTLAAMKQEVEAAQQPFSVEDAEGRVVRDIENWTRNNTALALYDAIGEYWNDDRSLVDRIFSKDRQDTVMQFHVNTGAATALAALAKEHLGLRLDTGRLVDKANLELASTAVAFQIRQKYLRNAQGYDDIVSQVRQHNAQNQRATEARALDRHQRLKDQYDTIQQQKEGKELLDEVKISSLEADNIIEQRKNLGSAFGSLQASATFYDALTKLRTATDDVVTVNVGSDPKDAEAFASRMGLREGKYIIDNMSDPDNVSVSMNYSALGRLITSEKDMQAKHDIYENLKTDMAGVVEDDNGNMVVDNYDVPGWKKTFIDESGTERDYNWRVEQRNDINWLREATQKTAENPDGRGGGLITRVVGAGKTNTSLGFFAHQLAENPDYKGLVVVPRGRAQQWHDEAKKFSDLNIELIPDTTAKDTVEELLANTKPGTIYLMGHREAARSHALLEAMQTNSEMKASFDGLVIDEPQELQARGQSGNIGAMGKRLMKLPMRHRVGLTATPARKNPLEAYDLIKWTQGSSKEIGSKASFNRTFSGFGSGTNAQDTAISDLYFKSIKPYISGDRITNPDFEVNHDSIDVSRSSTQVRNQRRIEAGSAAHIDKRRREIADEVRANPNHTMRRAQNWQSTLNRRATERARKEVEEQHQANIDGGDFNQNAKIQALRSELGKNPDSKHVVYVDSKTQRSAIAGMLADMGMGRNQIKNIASTATGSISGRDMAKRVKAFKDDPNVNIMLIDQSSASGYNLQVADTMHIVGNPVDAANYLQAQGRVARMPRKGDVGIKTYRYQDDPLSASKWNDLDAQLKVLRAAAPGMFA